MHFSRLPNQKIAVGFSEHRFDNADGEFNFVFPLSVHIELSKRTCTPDTLSIYIDLMSGYLWTVNRKGELINSVATRLPYTRMYMAIIVDKKEDQSVPSFQISYVIPKAIDQTQFTRYINTMNSVIEEFICGEIRFFQNVLQTDQSENRLRVYCKQMRYISVYYFLLSLQTMDPLFPLPLRFADLLKLDTHTRIKVMEKYPSLFEADKGSYWILPN